MRMNFVLAVAVVMALAFPAVAQTPATKPASSAGPSAIELTAAQRSKIAEAIISRWTGEVLKTPGGDVKAWSAKIRNVVAAGDAANIARASTMPSLDLAHAALVGASIDDAALAAAVTGTASSSAPQALGSVLSDTTYTPLPFGRCRVASSIAIANPLPAGVARPIAIEQVASYASQGGTGSTNGQGSTNCGIPNFVTAIVVSASSRNPVANGVLKVFANNKPNSAGNTILFSVAGGGGAADLIVQSCRMCNEEISIHATAQTDYIIDVIGYFMPPQVTALECTRTTSGDSVMGAFSFSTQNAPPCPATYTHTGTECTANNYGVHFSQSYNGQCSFENPYDLTPIVRADRVCCRVPGR